jgi:transcriptional regulator with XRE-family HTH domain/tetratricopeptide (TPR) repeat protein
VDTEEPSTGLESFGAALRQARTGRDLSLAGLSRLVHYSRSYLSKIETGLSTPNSALARRCDEALDAGGRLARLVPARPKARPATARAVTPADQPELTVRPFDVPVAPRHFVGREAELAETERLLIGRRELAGAGSVPIVVLHGMGGVGKTALAVLAAHRLAAEFPDGCLFVSLHSYAADQPAISVSDALDALLRRLGVPGRSIPERAEERAAYYRSVLYDRRVLVIVDDASRADQVRQMAPAGAGCAMLVTSRRRLTALDDGDPIRIDPLPLADAAALFRSVADTPDDPQIAPLVTDVVRSCGLLPLTVRIAAAGHRGRDTDDLAELAQRLADSATRLAELGDGERSATAILDASCTDLPAPQRRLLALLTLQPGARVTSQAAGWLTDEPADQCRRTLRGLTDDNLLLPVSADRYQMHDLTRTYAVDTLLHDLPDADRTAALRRLVTGYLAATTHVDERLTPHRHRPSIEPYTGAIPPQPFPDASAAAAWVAAEQATVVEVLALAAVHGWNAACWQLAYALRGWFFLAKAWDAWLATHRIAVRAAEQDGNDWAVAVTRNNLGLALIERGQLVAADREYRLALPVFRALGDTHGAANTLGHLAWARYCTHRDAAAVRLGNKALELYEQRDARRGIGITLRTIAMAQTRLRRFADAEAALRRALAMFTDLGLDLDATMTLNNLGGLQAQLGHLTASVHIFGQAVERAAACGSRYEQARAYDGLTSAAAAAGRPRAARLFAQRSQLLYNALHVPLAERGRIHPIGGLDPAVPQ